MAIDCQQIADQEIQLLTDIKESQTTNEALLKDIKILISALVQAISGKLPDGLSDN